MYRTELAKLIDKHTPNSLLELLKKEFKEKKLENRVYIEKLLVTGNLFYERSDYEKSLFFAKQALDYSRAHDLKTLIADSYLSIAKSYVRLGKFEISAQNLELAEINLNQIQDKTDKLLSIEAEVAKNRGNIAFYSKDYIAAEKAYSHSLNIAKCIKNQVIECEVLQNMALVFQHKAEFQKALNYFEKSKDMGKETDDLLELARRSNNIGELYRKIGDYERAKEYYLESLTLVKKTDNKFLLNYVLHNLGMVYYLLNDFEQAIQHYNDSLKVAYEIGNLTDTAETLFYLIRLHNIKKEYDEAEKLLEEFQILNESTKNELIDQYYKISYALNLLHQCKSRLDRLKAYLIVDNIFNKKEYHDQDIFLFSGFVLLQFFLEELIYTKQESVIDELIGVLEKLYDIPQIEQNCFSFINLKIVHAKIKLVMGDLDSAKKQLNMAKNYAERKNLQKSLNYITTQEKKLFTKNKLDLWTKNQDLISKIEETSITETIQHLIGNYHI